MDLSICLINNFTDIVQVQYEKLSLIIILLFQFLSKLCKLKTVPAGMFVFCIMECTICGLVMNRSEQCGVCCSNRKQVAAPHDVRMAVSAG
jgi:hypothetical protein